MKSGLWTYLDFSNVYHRTNNRSIEKVDDNLLKTVNILIVMP